jgi:hypothetical protein
MTVGVDMYATHGAQVKCCLTSLSYVRAYDLSNTLIHALRSTLNHPGSELAKKIFHCQFDVPTAVKSYFALSNFDESLGFIQAHGRLQSG